MLISSLKDDFEVYALVSMADDGGSTGRLRKELGTSAVGDIRQCLVAFTNSKTSKNLFSYRFGEGELEGHSFGNLFLATIENSSGNLYKAIDQARNILDIKEGDVVPLTDDKPNLEITHKNQHIRGVYKIANTNIESKHTEFNLDPPDSRISKKATEYIEKADLVIISPGNFYCSIIPALITFGLADALVRSKAKKVFISNLVNFPNHTRGYGTDDYLSEISRITRAEFIDILVANDNYNLSGEDAVKTNKPAKKDVVVIEDNLVSDEKNEVDPNDQIAALRSKVTHDKIRLNKIITQILRS